MSSAIAAFGAAHASKAGQELDRLLNLSEEHLVAETAPLLGYRDAKSLDCQGPSGRVAAVLKLPLAWAFDEAAAMMEARDEWRQTMRAWPKDLLVRTPSSFVLDSET